MRYKQKPYAQTGTYPGNRAFLVGLIWWLLLVRKLFPSASVALCAVDEFLVFSNGHCLGMILTPQIKHVGNHAIEDS